MKMQLTTTCYDKENQKVSTTTPVKMEECPNAEHQLFCLFPQVRYQEIEGFGGALTDSTAYIYSLMSPEQKKEFLHQCFDPQKGKFNTVRIPLDSCDFSLAHFEADSNPEDVEFKEFSLDRVKQYILPLLDDAQKVFGGPLDIMLSPWSPPAFMKSNGERNHGGTLKPEFRAHWANYICHYIKAYREMGYSVTKLTLQNEPKATQTWDSCVYTPEEQRDFLKDVMWKALEQANLTDIQIYIWDHNKESVVDWADTVITPETAHMVAGLGFHWYSGDHFQQLSMVKEKFPNLKLLLSEACIEFSKYDADNFLENAQKYGHDMIGNLNAGMNTFIDWNLLLDQEGGPNHVGNFCDAPFLFDLEKKELMQRNIYDYVWHFSHFIPVGSHRIGSSIYSDKIESVAFQSGETMVYVLLNRSQEELPLTIQCKGFCGSILLPPLSISTGEIFPS